MAWRPRPITILPLGWCFFAPAISCCSKTECKTNLFELSVDGFAHVVCHVKFFFSDEWHGVCSGQHSHHSSVHSHAYCTRIVTERESGKNTPTSALLQKQHSSSQNTEYVGPTKCQSVRMSKITNDDGSTRSGIGCFIAVPIRQQWASKGYWLQWLFDVLLFHFLACTLSVFLWMF